MAQMIAQYQFNARAVSECTIPFDVIAVAPGLAGDPGRASDPAGRSGSAAASGDFLRAGARVVGGDRATVVFTGSQRA